MAPDPREHWGGLTDSPTKTLKLQSKVSRIFFVVRSGLLGYNLLTIKSSLLAVVSWVLTKHIVM